MLYRVHSNLHGPKHTHTLPSTHGRSTRSTKHQNTSTMRDEGTSQSLFRFVAGWTALRQSPRADCGPPRWIRNGTDHCGCCYENGGSALQAPGSPSLHSGTCARNMTARGLNHNPTARGTSLQPQQARIPLSAFCGGQLGKYVDLYADAETPTETPSHGSIARSVTGALALRLAPTAKENSVQTSFQPPRRGPRACAREFYRETSWRHYHQTTKSRRHRSSNSPISLNSRSSSLADSLPAAPSPFWLGASAGKPVCLESRRCLIYSHEITPTTRV